MLSVSVVVFIKKIGGIIYGTLLVLRTLSGKGVRKNKPIKNYKGEPLVTQEQLKRWEEYFSGILNKGKDKKTQSTEEEAEENIKLQRLKGH
jgi:hypothetical protein